MSQRIVLATFGSFGDLNPFLGIGRELRKRGFDPVFASSVDWRSHIENAGFEFRHVRPGWDEQLDPRYQIEYLTAHGVFTDFRASFDDLLAAVSDADALVTYLYAVAAPLVAQKAGLPWVSVVIEPLSFFSAYEQALLPAGLPLAALKEASKPLCEPVARVREELGLPPGGNPFFDEYLTADAVLALFSPLLAPPQPDWPPETVITGFVAYDQFTASSPELERLRAFLNAGTPPVVFTLSSDAVNTPIDNFYAESLLAAQMLGRRAILIGLHLPQTQTANVLTVSHIPFSEVFPHAAAVVCHSGIGTAAIGLKAGKPMLVVPGLSQPDIAARLVRLGIARSIPRAAYRAATAARELWALLSDPGYATRAAAVASRVALEDGARSACDVIERVLQEHRKPLRGTVSQSAALPEAIVHHASRKMTEADTYLHLLKKTLTRYPLALNEELTMLALRDMEPALIQQIIQWGMSGHSRIKGSNGFNPMLRSLGMDWPDEAETMIGLARLDNLEYCITSALQRNVPGDLVETGVWRGGAAIFMRAVLRAYGDVERKVWLADSFEGFPKPDEDNYPADRDSNLWTLQQLSVSLDNVKANFARYGLLDERVKFLPGWFSETLPTAPIDRIAVLRLDGAMYESTIVALRSLYQKVSPGGFVIIDDYNYVPQCQQAVDDFRREEDIIEALCPVDLVSVYWRVSALEKSSRGSNTKSLGASL